MHLFIADALHLSLGLFSVLAGVPTFVISLYSDGCSSHDLSQTGLVSFVNGRVFPEVQQKRHSEASYSNCLRTVR